MKFTYSLLEKKINKPRRGSSKKKRDRGVENSFSPLQQTPPSTRPKADLKMFACVTFWRERFCREYSSIEDKFLGSPTDNFFKN